jgi:[histone H3]-dimethyl-L-lysine9 demethylase
MHGGEPEPEPDKLIDKDETCLSSYQSKSIKWDADPQGNIYCPASELDGRGNHILELKQILPKDWFSKLEMNAFQISKQLETSDITRTDTCECSCSDNHGSSRKAASRENSTDNYIYCPISDDGTPDELKHFQRHWIKGEPVLVQGVLQKMSHLSWDPPEMWLEVHGADTGFDRASVNAI